MSVVLFKFVGPDGTPWSNLRLTVQPENSFFQEELPGIVIPRALEAYTDENGEASMNLRPSTEKYHLSLLDIGSCPVAEFVFVVPSSETSLRFQDLLL